MKHLAIRLPEQELEILKAFCDQENRTQSEVSRSLKTLGYKFIDLIQLMSYLCSAALGVKLCLGGIQKQIHCC